MSSVRVNAIPKNLAEPVGYTREVYAVDDVRVTLDSRRGWECGCKSDTDDGNCTHIEQAKVFRTMRGAHRDEDTIQLHLTGADLKALVAIPATAHDVAGPARSVRRRRRRLHMSRFSAVAAAAAVAVLSSGLTYLTIARAHPLPSADPILEAALPEERTPEPAAESLPLLETPVTFVNPFDRTEVFEFPSSTTESDAREAVADFLLQRAKDRLGGSSDMRRRGKSADRHRSRTTNLAQRS